MAANQVDFKILPSDQFSVYSPQTRSDKVITYFTLLSKLRGDILSVGQEDDPNNIVSAFYINTGNVQTLHLVKADGSEVTASNSFAGTVTSVDMSVPTGFSISGNPITTSGTLAVGFASGYSLPTNAIQATWTTAYNRSLTSAAVTGTSTKTLTLNQQNGGTITASWSDIDTGLTSVGLTMPAAFSVANSPLTANGTLAVTAAGLSSQYIRGDGQLANFPTPGGGGSSVNYYLNGSVSQGTFGGVTYYELSKTPIAGAGTNFTRTSASGDGYVASFITDANDPDQINIPGGNWNLEFYFNSSSSGGHPAFYGELYKVSVSNVFTLIASGSVNPESITGGTSVDQYYTSIAVPQTALLATDRLAIRVYVIVDGRNVTLHTENSNFSEVITTFSTGLNSLNGLSDQVQYFAVGTSGTDFSISSSVDTHTFNLPTASATNRGALSSADWTTFNSKQGTITLTTTGTTGAATFISNTLNIPSYTDQFVGTVTSVNLTAGTGITVSGGPITTSGSITVNNSDRGSSQNIFKNFAVAGQSTIVADTNDDTLTIVAGSGVTLTTNDTTDTLTISASGSGGTVTSVGTSAPLTGGPITATGTIGITQSGVSTDGYLSSTDWNTFNNKQSTLLFSGPLVNTSGTVSIPVATTSVSGYLNNTDWTTFNSKQNAITLTTTGTTGAATLIGATLNIPNYADQFVGTVTSVNMSVPTGFAISGNPITTSGTLAVAFAAGYSLPTNASQTTWNTAYNDSITAFAYNTSTAVLTLTQQDAGTLTATVTLQPFSTSNLAEGTNLYYTDTRARLALSAGTGISYDSATGIITNSAPDQTVVLTGGTGITTSGTYPSFTVTNSDRGSSQNIFKNIAVAGQSTIVADTNDDTLTVVAGSGVTITTNDTTDTITISATGSGGSVTSVGTTAPITGGTITTTGTIGITQSGAAADGYLSSTDWNTFNNKQNALTNPVTGTGTTNYVSKFTSGSAIGNSQIFDDGTSVGIGTASPLAKLHVAGTVATDSALADVSAYRIIKPNSGFRVTANSSETGAIKITYPVGFTNTMHRIKLNVYEYVTNESFTIYFGGYNYAPGSSWYNPFAYILGNPSKDQNYTVRFGYNGTSMVVYIGELATGWTYPQIFIEEVELGYGGMSNTWRDGAWTISFEASAFQNVTETVSNTQATNLARSGSNAYYGFGNVGIGTTSPGSLLQVGNAGAAPTGLATLTLTGANTAPQIATKPGLYHRHAVGLGVFSDYAMSFQVNGSSALSDAMFITNDSKVGIGTTGPLAKLEVSAGAGTPAFNNGIAIVTGNSTFTTGHGGILQFQNEDVITAAVRGVRESGWGSGLALYTHNTSSGNTFGTTVVERMRITESGNVGIGTTAPQAPLHVIAASSANDALIQEWSYTSADLDVYSLMLKQTVTSGVVRYNFSMVNNSTAYNDVLVLDRGKVGIGTTNPDVKFHVQGSNLMATLRNSDTAANQYSQLEFVAGSRYAYIWLGNQNTTSWAGDGGLNIYTDFGNMDFWTAGTQKMRLTASGNLGIGTTNPTQILHVTGNIRVTGAYYDSGNSAGTSGQILSSTATGTSWIATTGGTVTSVGLTGGTGITISGGPITTSGSITVTNSAPDQTVVLTGGTGITTSGTYPSFTVTNSAPDQTVALTAGTGISISGTYPSFTITNTSAGGGTITGSGTTNYVSKFTSASAIGDSSIFDNGNVGIGTALPGYKLDVDGGSALATARFYNSSNVATVVYVGDSGNTDYSDIILQTNSGNGEIFKAGTGYTSYGGALALNIYNSNGAIAFHPNNTANAMFIATNSNVGINTTSPSYKLDVFSGSITSRRGLSSPRFSSTGEYNYGVTNSPTWNVNQGAYTNNNATSPDGTTTAGTYTLTTVSWDLYQTIPVTSGVEYTVGAWVKLGTATNFCIVINNTLAWNTVGGKAFDSSDGLSTSKWTHISFTFTGPASGNVNLHIGAHSESGVPQQTAGTVFLWNWEMSLLSSTWIGKVDDEIRLPGSSIWTSRGNVGIANTSAPIKLYVGSVLTGTNGNGTYASDAIAVNSSESITIGPDRRADWTLNAATATSTTFQSKLNIWSDNEDHITFGGASTHLVSAWESFKIWINNDSADAGTLHLYHTSSKTEFVRFAGSGNSWINGGNVGIGTTAPYGRLELNGSGQSWTTAPAIRMWDSFNSKGWLVGNVNNITPGDFYIRTLPSVSGDPGSGQQEFTIKHATGNVGIGTTSPTGRLDIRSSGLDTNPLTIYGTTSGAKMFDFRDDSVSGVTAAMFRMYNASGTETVRLFPGTTTTHHSWILPTGNFGIGTTAPKSKLQIVGPTLTTNNENTYAVWVSDTGDDTKALLLGYDLVNDVGVIQAVDQALAWKNISIASNGGNVLIGTTTDNGYKLNVNGSGYFNGTGYFENRVQTNNSFSDANNVRVLKPLGGSRNSTTPTETGAIKITYPVGYTNTMHRVKLNIYNYSGNQAYTVYFGGYNYGPGPYWVNVFAYTIGPSSTDFNPTVRFGYDGTKMVVYVGELNTSWSYPQFFIEEVETGFNLASQFATDAWSIGLEASAFQNVTDSIPNTSSTNWARSGSSAYYGFGNVGIGTTAPNSKLSVNGGDFEFNRGTGALGNYYVVINKGASNDGGIILRRDNANDWQISNLAGTGNLSFYAYGAASEVLTILRSNGNVGINNTNPSYRLDVTGDARINTGALGVNIAPSATDGRIDASNDIVAFSSSDLRLKENIKPIENALDKVKSLTGVEFDWKPELKHAHGYEGHDTGVIAQEVQEVMPTAIRTNDTGYLAVRYEKLIGLLIEGMKEQQLQIDELKSKLK